MAISIAVHFSKTKVPQHQEAYRRDDDDATSLDLYRIGQALKEARLAKGLSLDDVSDALFIRKSALGAIEGGHWERLPHAVYVKGYVKLYASYLNMPEKIKADMQPASTAIAGDSVQDLKHEKRVEAPKERRPKRFTRHFLLISSSVIVLIAGLLFYPGPQSTVSFTKLQEVSVGFFNAEHSMVEVRKLLIPYTQRPWLNPFAEAGETRTMILDLPDTTPMTNNDPLTNAMRHDEG